MVLPYDGKTSVLWERIEAGEMPPEDHLQLSENEKKVIGQWLTSGAHSDDQKDTTDEWTERLQAAKEYWAFTAPNRPTVPGWTEPPAYRTGEHTETGKRTNVDDPSIKSSLQAWYRAESISLAHGERVEVWRDESGNDRHLRPTWRRLDSQTGTPPRFMVRSTVNGKPAVRFDDLAGLGSPADNPVDISGNAEWTMVAVVNIRPPSLSSHTSVIVGFGDPSPGHNPGKPWASLLEIRRDNAFLSHSGGYGHDARMPQQTMWPMYERPIVVTVVKRSGPMAQATSLFVNGSPIGSDQIDGVGSNPDIRHRNDFGVYLGRANGSLGALRGDVAEVAVFNSVLNTERRESLEASLIAKYLGSPSRKDMPARQLQIESGKSVNDANPIDAFIKRKLDQKELSSAPRADRRTLIRRAYFDLIGLPPKPEEVEAFVNDVAPYAWERVIEKLLHSRHYGERWGRHWLDVARYADTGGYETDVYYRNAWRYRDYVVKSFNDDKPYDQFVQEQIAGDEIWPDNLDLHGSYILDPEKKRHLEASTGTGLYALGPMIHESNMDAKKLSNERLTDWVDTTGFRIHGTHVCLRSVPRSQVRSDLSKRLLCAASCLR